MYAHKQWINIIEENLYDFVRKWFKNFLIYESKKDN